MRRAFCCMLFALVALGTLHYAKAQTIYSPTAVSCTKSPANANTIINPTGPETQSGGEAAIYTISNPPPHHPIWVNCSWTNFGSGNLPAAATLSIPFVYDYPGNGGPYDGSANVGASVCTSSTNCTSLGLVSLTSGYNGTITFAVPAGTDLSEIGVGVIVYGAIGYPASAFVSWINIQ